MKQPKWIGTGSVAVMVLIAGSMIWAAAPQDQPQTPLASAEYSAYQTAHDEKDAQAKIKLLDDFTVKYPDSALALYVYQDYYVAYFSVKNYAQAAAYADKLLELGDKADLDSRMLAVLTREVAYSAGCGDRTFHAPDASVKARNAATQGLQMLNEWQEPANLSSEQFAAAKTAYGIILNSVARDAESRLKGETVICYMDHDPDPGRFDRMIDEILSEQRQAPRVR